MLFCVLLILLIRPATARVALQTKRLDIHVLRGFDDLNC